MPNFAFRRPLRWLLALLLLPAWLLVFWAFFGTQSVRPRETVVLPVPRQRVWCLSPDGHAFLAPVGDVQETGSELAVGLWSTTSGEKLVELKGHTEVVRAVAFSPDRATVATVSWDGSARIWDLHTGQERLALRPAGKRPNFVVFSRDGKTLITGAPIKRWRLEDGTELDTAAFKTGSPLGLWFLPGGQAKLALAEARTVELYDLDTGRKEHSFTGFPPPLLTGLVSLSPDGKTVANALRDGSASVIEFWDLATGQKQTSHKLSAEPIGAGSTAISYSSDGRYLIVGQLLQHPLVRLLNPVSRQFSYRVAVGFQPELQCAVLDVTTGECWQGLPYAFHTAFSSDGSTLYTIGDHGLQVWDVPPQRVRFSPTAWGFLAGALVLSGAWWFVRRRVKGPYAYSNE
jgi:hypothetical protein